MKSLFCIIGFLSGVCLSIFDFITSMMGFSQLLPESSVFKYLLPPVFAALALSMNALASSMVTLLVQKRDTQFSVLLIGFAFIVCMIFDAASSWLGFVMEFGGSNDVVVAVKTAGGIRLVAATVTAIFVTIGPFLTLQFHEMVKEQGGFLACCFGFLNFTK